MDQNWGRLGILDKKLWGWGEAFSITVHIINPNPLVGPVGLSYTIYQEMRVDKVKQNLKPYIQTRFSLISIQYVSSAFRGFILKNFIADVAKGDYYK